MLEEKLYQSGDIKLNYVEGPDNGPAFLLLPAYDDRWQSYSSIIPQLAANTHLYALDTRGRGKSGRAKDYELVNSVRDSLLCKEATPARLTCECSHCRHAHSC